MTRSQAAETLRAFLGEGDSSEVSAALVVAIRALEPAKRAAKPKASPAVAAFLKMRFPEGVAARTSDFYPDGKVPDPVMTPEGAAQFAYRSRATGARFLTADGRYQYAPSSTPAGVLAAAGYAATAMLEDVAA